MARRYLNESEISHAINLSHKVIRIRGRWRSVGYAVLLAEKYGFDRDVNLVVSTATPLGEAILGAKRGETVKYEAGGESLRAKVVSIEVSPLFQES